MKKIIYLLFCLLISLASMSQTQVTRTTRANTVADSRLRALLNFYVPTGSAVSLNGGLDSTGALFFKTSDSTLNVRVGNNSSNSWLPLASKTYVDGHVGFSKDSTFQNVRVKAYATVAALRAGTEYINGVTHAITQGYSVQGDGGQAEYRWNASSTATDDGAFVINPTGHTGPGRWEYLSRNGRYSALALGVVADGSTDQTALLNYLFSAPKRDLLLDRGTVKISGVVDGKFNKLIIQNDAMITGVATTNADTLKNVQIEADFRRQIFDTSLAVAGIKSTWGMIPLTWWGRADYLYNGGSSTWTDNANAIDRAINAGPILNSFQSTLYKTKIYAPAGDSDYWYYVGRTIHFKYGIEFFGDGIESTTLIFPPSVPGFILDYGTYQNISKNVYLHDFRLSGNVGQAQESTTYFDGLSHGITIHSSYNRIENVKVQFFNADGLHIEGNTSPWIADHNYILNCQSVANSGSGLKLTGNDANANNIIGGTYDGNAQWGVCDSAYLQNFKVGYQTSSNGFHSKNRSLVYNAGRGYMCIQANTNIEPGVASGWQNYWRDLGVGTISTYYPQWLNSVAYALSGGSYQYNVNSLGVALDLYDEGGQYEGKTDGNELAVGGNHAFSVNGPAITMFNGIPTIKPALKIGNVQTQNFLSLWNNEIAFTPNSGRRDGFLYDPATGTFVLEQNGSNGDFLFMSNGNGSPASYIGRSSWPDLYNLLVKNVFIKRQDVGGWRGLSMFDTKPADSYGADGEFAFSTGASDTLLYKKYSGAWHTYITGGGGTTTTAPADQVLVGTGTGTTSYSNFKRLSSGILLNGFTSSQGAYNLQNNGAFYNAGNFQAATSGGSDHVFYDDTFLSMKFTAGAKSFAYEVFNSGTGFRFSRAGVGPIWSAHDDQSINFAADVYHDALAGTGTRVSALDASGKVLRTSIDPATIAPLASPAFTGSPTAPTQTAGDNTTNIATTAFVTAAVAGGGSGTESLTLVSTQNFTLPNGNGNYIYEFSTGGGTFTMPSSPTDGQVIWISNTTSGTITFSTNIFESSSTSATTLAATKHAKLIYKTSTSKWYWFLLN